VPVGTEVGLGPGHIVLDGDTAPPSLKKGHYRPPTFWPKSIVAKPSPVSATAELLFLSLCTGIVHGSALHTNAEFAQVSVLRRKGVFSMMAAIVFHFWATICKMVRPMLSDRCVCPACEVGVLWPNGWMHQDETWYRGSHGPGDIVLDVDPASPQFLPQPRLLWSNGWMHKHTTLYGGKPWPR